MGATATDAATVDGVLVRVGSRREVGERGPPLFDLVHGGVRAAQDPAAGPAGHVHSAGDAEGDVQAQRVLLVLKGLLELLTQSGDLRERGCRREHHRNGEFVASQPGRERLAGRGPPGEALADGLDDGVARGVPVGVVDGLEADPVQQKTCRVGR